MIKELIPLLKTHRLDLRVELKGEHLHVYIIPKVLEEVAKREAMDAKDTAVLEAPRFRKYSLGDFTNEKLVEDIHAYSNALIEGTCQITELNNEINRRLNEKKKKPAPKKKKETVAQRKKREQEEAREKQAKEREGQSDLPLDEGDRLSTETEAEDIASAVDKKEEEKKELKTAAEKAVERVKQKPVEKVEPTDADPLGLGDLDLDI